MLTIEEIRAMSPEELEATNKALARSIVKRMLVRGLVVGVLAYGASYALDRKLNNTSTPTE